MAGVLPRRCCFLVPRFSFIFHSTEICPVRFTSIASLNIVLSRLVLHVYNSLFAIKRADRIHSRVVVPVYKLECEDRACTNNKMAAGFTRAHTELCVPTYTTPPDSIHRQPTSHDASLPRGRKGCFAGARTSSILSECLAV